MKGKMLGTIPHGPNDLRIEEIEIPQLQAHEVLIRVRRNGICPSGLAAMRSGQTWSAPGTVIPGFPGHEFSGDIVEVAPDVKNLKVGDRVASNLIINCGRCRYCVRGKANLCESTRNAGSFAYATYLKALDACTYKIADTLPYNEATFAEPLACVLNGFEMSNIHASDNVLIIGTGPIGLMHLLVAKHVGGSRVLVSEPKKDRMILAKKLGASAVINPVEEDLVKWVRNETGGYGADTVIVAVPNIAAMNQALQTVAKTGTVNFFGGIKSSTPQHLQLDPNLLHYGEIQITGSHNKTPRQFEVAVKLLNEGIIDVKPLISHELPFNSLMKGFDIVEKQEGLKVIIKVDEQ